MDGKISKDEWVAKYGSDIGWAVYDMNQDGDVDIHEWKEVNVPL